MLPGLALATGVNHKTGADINKLIWGKLIQLTFGHQNSKIDKGKIECLSDKIEPLPNVPRVASELR